MHNHTYAFVVDAVGLAVNSPTTVYRSTDICTWRFISYKSGTMALIPNGISSSYAYVVRRIMMNSKRKVLIKSQATQDMQPGKPSQHDREF